MSVSRGSFSAPERAAFSGSGRRLSGSEWAERHRRLSVRDGSTPGRFVPHPYQRAWLDDLCDPSAPRRLIFRKSAQVAGCSETVRTAILYWLAEDPAPVRLVLPDEQTARSIMRARILPMLRSHEVTRGLLPAAKRDLSLLSARLLNDAEVSIGWAGSPTRLAADPIARAVGDEVDKWPAWSGREGSPTALLFARTKTYRPRDKQVLISTPTIPYGEITRAARRAGEQLVFAVPCAGCGERERLTLDRLRWAGGSPAEAPDDPDERRALAALLEGPGRVWLACDRCGVETHDRDKARCLDSGLWVPEQAGAKPDPEDDPEEPGSWAASRAYHVSDLYGPHHPLGVVAAGWLRAITPQDRMEYHNQTLGEAYHDEECALTADLFAARATWPNGLVPSWATSVVCAADTQAAGWWWVARAVGKGGRSRGLAWGWATTEALLLRATVNRTWPLELGGQARAAVLLVDAGGGMNTPDGSRSQEVYDLARREARVTAIRGANARDALSAPPLRRTTIDTTARGARRRHDLVWLNTQYWKDVVAAAVADGDRWQEATCAGDATYGRHMSAEAKVLIRTAGGVERWRWERNSKHAPRDLWHCAVYATAGAEIVRAEHRAPLGAAEATVSRGYETAEDGTWKFRRGGRRA